MKEIKSVTCGIILKENKILVTQRSETMKLPLKWEFPGGKIEFDESAKDCLDRELKEELNIVVEILEEWEGSLYDYGKYHVNLIPFVANYSSGEIILLEHKEYKWINSAELELLDWAPADIPIVEKFLKSEYGSSRIV